jgi:hypothetical protein
VSEPVTTDGGTNDDQHSPPDTDAQESPETTRATAPAEDAPSDTAPPEPPAPDDTTATGGD